MLIVYTSSSTDEIVDLQVYQYLFILYIIDIFCMTLHNQRDGFSTVKIIIFDFFS